MFTANAWNPRDEQIAKIYELLPEGAASEATRSTSTTCC